jgi:hypothetical protein
MSEQQQAHEIHLDENERKKNFKLSTLAKICLVFLAFDFGSLLFFFRRLM